MNIFFYGNFYVKLVSGKEYYFFHDNEKGICYKQKEEKEIEILLKNGNRDFSIDVVNNNIHLICSDTEGSLIYLHLDKDNKWNKYIVLKNKNGKAKPEYFSIHVINNWINVFYTLFHNNKLLLVHHIINNQNTSPTVVDYIARNNFNYSVYTDNFGNILLFYYNNTSPYKFGLRKYEWGKKKWSTFHSLIDNSNNKVINPSVLIDKELTCHITFLQKNNSVVNLMYCKIKEPYNMPIDNPIVLKGNISSNNTPIILGIKDKIHICWKSQTSIYTCSSENNGDSWSKPSYFLCAPNSPMIINFKSEIKEDKETLTCFHCYGYVNQTIYLHLVSDHTKDPVLPNQNKTCNINSSENRYNQKIVDNHFQTTPSPNTIDIEKLKISQTLIQNELNNVKKRIINLERKIMELNELPKSQNNNNFNTISEDNVDNIKTDNLQSNKNIEDEQDDELSKHKTEDEIN